MSRPRKTETSPSKAPRKPGRNDGGRQRVEGVEALEGRQLLTTFHVSSLSAFGAGSLQRAILQANAKPGADTVVFDVDGTIKLGRSPLASITDKLTIDGTSAPNFNGTPQVTLDFQRTRGLRFDLGSDGSTLTSLSLVNASNSGVTLNASHITIQGNYIGLRADGTTIGSNAGDGVRINPSSHGNLIGSENAVSGVSYYGTSSLTVQPVSLWQGLRPGMASGSYLISGTSNNQGLLYEGPINGQGGTSYALNVPGASSTSVYGPDLLSNGDVRLVGVYQDGNDKVNGFLYQGAAADLGNASNYRTIDYPNAKYTYVHSTMGDLAVGNADGPEGNLPIGTGHAFLYNVTTNAFLPDIVYPGSASTTAYGIWYNGEASYTIAGGYSKVDGSGAPVGSGFLVDYNERTGVYSNWTSFSYPNGGIGQTFVTHFEGISSTESGVYTLVADSLQTGSANPAQGSWVSVRRNSDNTFGPAVWVDLNDPSAPAGKGSITSANSVTGNQVVGIVIGGGNIVPYQSTVNTAFQLSNVISGNGGNGIGIYGSNDNRIAMNEIGTDVSGTLRRGNRANGILVTKGASGNLIGGQATGGNNPTGGYNASDPVIVRPPQGNLISANGGSGVLISNKATKTLLSGNFIGTAASGNSALGNRLDGVDIENSDDNSLIGCTFHQNPFVFYNVLSGNGGNGLRINNSNNTTVQANFIGTGADNTSTVANGGDGLLVSGTSKTITLGGPIPLGNVIAGNRRNGIEVRDRASGFLSFNTFAGLHAFGAAAPNQLDGILVTSTGGNNVIQTCIVSGNLGNGIEIGGNATGVQVTETAVGTNSTIKTALPNQKDGILITGNAHGNTIGGFQPSIEPQVTVSANMGYGIEFAGNANNNSVVHTYVGTNYNASVALGNNLGGIILGAGTRSNTIGGATAPFADKILYNNGNGVTIRSSSGNNVIGNEIADSAANGILISGNVNGTTLQSNDIDTNGANGLFLDGTVRLTIGGSYPGAGNRVVGNKGYGLFARGLNVGTTAQGNIFLNNGKGKVNTSGATGIPSIS